MFYLSVTLTWHAVFKTHPHAVHVDNFIPFNFFWWLTVLSHEYKPVYFSILLFIRMWVFSNLACEQVAVSNLIQISYEHVFIFYNAYLEVKLLDHRINAF